MSTEPIIKQIHTLPREKFPNNLWLKERYVRDSIILSVFGTATVVGVIYFTKPTWSRWIYPLFRSGQMHKKPFSSSSGLGKNVLLHPQSKRLDQTAQHSTFPHNLVSPTVHRRFVIAGRVFFVAVVLFALRLTQSDKRLVTFVEYVMEEEDDDDH
uniref:Essential MCU regulator, mitochondrial n=1 Tax=Globodera pallida TaxID=36090 RepID=A0A183CPB4_GLOPA